MKHSVGIGGSIHDFATCLINENGQIFAIEDERISRVRYALFAPNPCELSFPYILDWAGVSPGDIDQVVGNDMLEPDVKAVREGNTLGPTISGINKGKFPPLNLLNHHLTHAYSTFFSSSYDEAAILVVDGVGSLTRRGTPVPERETMTYSVGRHNTITTIGAVKGDSSGSSYKPEYPPMFNNSLGHMYRAVTEVVGFGWMNAGKTMGLAPWGDDRYVEEVMRYIRLLPDGQYEIRIGGSDGMLAKLIQLREEGRAKDDHFKVDAALAYGVQAALENVMFHALDYLWEKTKTPNLCLAGGVALNGLVNGLIPKRTKFKNVHVFFAPGDGGTAIGSAMWDYVNRRDSSADRIRFDSGPFWGRPYSNDAIKKALDASGLASTRPANLYQETAQLLANGKTVAWYEGGAEFGPRALGHRTILADPRDPKMLDHVNKDIKGREWFRPIAPAVTEPAATKYFEADCYSPWMQFVWPVREQYRAALPAITHTDGSSRIQTVRKRGNESLYALLEAFEQITGLPILINTSFNIQGDPIVETPEQAIESFQASALDVLVLGEYVIKK